MTTKRTGLYSLRSTVIQTVLNTYTEVEITTNLAIQDKKGMAIQSIEFEAKNLDAALTSYELTLSDSTSENMGNIDEERIVCKLRLYDKPYQGIWRVDYLNPLIIAQKSLYLAVDSADSAVMLRGFVVIRYEIIKLTDSELIALASR